MLCEVTQELTKLCCSHRILAFLHSPLPFSKVVLKYVRPALLALS